jgi:Tfp pilus assembly protein PilV
MTRTTRRRSRRRGGFTIVEVIVAILMIVVGVLGLASTAAVVQRLIAGGAQQTIAASRAQSRFERMRSRPCNQLSGGTATQRGITETWTVDSVAPRLRVVRDSVFFISGRRQPQAYRSLVIC